MFLALVGLDHGLVVSFLNPLPYVYMEVLNLLMMYISTPTLQTHGAQRTQSNSHQAVDDDGDQGTIEPMDEEETKEATKVTKEVKEVHAMV